jgi:hypothetical protein
LRKACKWPYTILAFIWATFGYGHNPDKEADSDVWQEEDEELKVPRWSREEVLRRLYCFFVSAPLQRHSFYSWDLGAKGPAVSWLERARWTLAAAVEHFQPEDGCKYSNNEMNIPEELFQPYVKAKTARIIRFQPFPTKFERFCLRAGAAVPQGIFHQGVLPPPPVAVPPSNIREAFAHG